jgi:hypothetical protein
LIGRSKTQTIGAQENDLGAVGGAPGYSVDAHDGGAELWQSAVRRSAFDNTSKPSVQIRSAKRGGCEREMLSWKAIASWG